MCSFRKLRLNGSINKLFAFTDATYIKILTWSKLDTTTKDKYIEYLEKTEKFYNQHHNDHTRITTTIIDKGTITPNTNPTTNELAKIISQQQNTKVIGELQTQLTKDKCNLVDLNDPTNRITKTFSTPNTPIVYNDIL